MAESTLRLGSRNSFVSLRPFGLGMRREHHLTAALSAVGVSRSAPRFALDVLRHGVCSDCSLGTDGWRDSAIAGPHLCSRRLRGLGRWTGESFDPASLPALADLRLQTPRKLRAHGRVPVPLLYRPDSDRFETLSWDDATSFAASRLKDAPRRWGLLAEPSLPSNEAFFALQKLARRLKTPHIDLVGDAGHRSALSVLQWTTGLGAGTCALQDTAEAEVVVLWGTGLHRHPFLGRLLRAAKASGTRVIAIGPFAEPEFEGVWLPASPVSALFGSRIVDDFFAVRGGGDRHLAWGLLAALSETESFDGKYLVERVEGWKRIRSGLDSLRWEDVEEGCGLDASRIRHLARLLTASDRTVLLTGAALGRGAAGSETIGAVVALALCLGILGTPGAGILPLGGESGVRGARDLGFGPDLGPAGGMTAARQVRAALRGDLDLLYVVGEGLDELLPPGADARHDLQRVGVRIHQVLHLDPSVLIEAGEAVLVLPAQSRFEQRGGSTSTSVDRTVRFSPEIRGHEIGEARPDWQIPTRIAQRVDPSLRDVFDPLDSAAVREAIAREVPRYAELGQLHAPGDSFRWGSDTLHVDGFALPGGRARMPAITIPETAEEGLRLTTRRSGRDRTGIIIAAPDAERLGLSDGAAARLTTAHGILEGVIRIAPVIPGTVQTYWPEGRCLFPSDPQADAGPPGPAIVTLEAS